MKQKDVKQIEFQRKVIAEEHQEYIDEKVKLILAGKKIKK